MLYRDISVKLQLRNYSHSGRWAIRMFAIETGEPVALITVNLPDEELNSDEIFVKDYSENAGMLAWLVAQDLVEDTGRKVQSGYVSIPVARVLPKLREILDA